MNFSKQESGFLQFVGLYFVHDWFVILFNGALVSNKLYRISSSVYLLTLYQLIGFVVLIYAPY
jgi:hypothetical protein